MKNKDEMATKQEMINRKRKFSEPQEEEDHDIDLELTLSPPAPPPPPPEKQPPTPLQEEEDHQNDLQPTLSPYFPPTTPPPPPTPVPVWSAIRSTPLTAAPSPSPRRQRKIQTVKSETIPAPYRWATTRRATVQSLADLESQQIFTIRGDVQCNNCESGFEIQYDLREKFYEVGDFIVKNKDTMHDRAPKEWLNPVLPIACNLCQKQSNVKPVIAKKKREINWLFLLLGQMIGCCNLKQLKYFCKHTNNHRTGAKDRLLYSTYLGLCKQLVPNGPFDPY